jgi:AcrR family transcriptional regulator
MSTKRRGASRREEILQEAEKLFAEFGFRETSLDDVAAKLGVRRQAIYYYFESKDDILVELSQKAGAALRESASDAFNSDLPPREKLENVIRNHVEQVLTNADSFRIQFAEIGRVSPEQRERVRRDQAGYVRQVAAIISAGQRLGEFAEAPATPQALLILGMCNWTLEWYEPTSRLKIADIADLAVRLCLEGLLATRAGPSADVARV